MRPTVADFIVMWGVAASVNKSVENVGFCIIIWSNICIFPQVVIERIGVGDL